MQNVWATSAHPYLVTTNTNRTNTRNARPRRVGIYAHAVHTSPFRLLSTQNAWATSAPYPAITNTHRTNTHNARPRRVGIHAHAVRTSSFRLPFHAERTGSKCPPYLAAKKFKNMK